MRFLGILPVLLLVASSPLAGTIPTPPTMPQEPITVPGGLADPSGRNGYISNAQGGIDAIDLKTGEVLWSTSEAERPLFLQGQRLIAQAGTRRNRIRILVFDVQQGEGVLESDPVVLPIWVVTGEAVGRSFAARWRVEGNLRCDARSQERR